MRLTETKKKVELGIIESHQNKQRSPESWETGQIVAKWNQSWNMQTKKNIWNGPNGRTCSELSEMIVQIAETLTFEAEKVWRGISNQSKKNLCIEEMGHYLQNQVAELQHQIK